MDKHPLATRYYFHEHVQWLLEKVEVITVITVEESIASQILPSPKKKDNLYEM